MLRGKAWLLCERRKSKIKSKLRGGGKRCLNFNGAKGKKKRMRKIAVKRRMKEKEKKRKNEERGRIFKRVEK